MDELKENIISKVSAIENPELLILLNSLVADMIKEWGE